jgi:hypothetical protein
MTPTRTSLARLLLVVAVLPHCGSPPDGSQGGACNVASGGMMYSCTGDLICAAADYPGVCRPPHSVPPGGSCRTMGVGPSSSLCESGICPSNGVCTAPAARGQACQDGSYCASSLSCLPCEGAPSLCEPDGTDVCALEGCTLVTHSDPYGDKTTDCAPLGACTYGEALALCQAYYTSSGATGLGCEEVGATYSDPAVAGSPNAAVCLGGDVGPCECWGFAGPQQCHVTLEGALGSGYPSCGAKASDSTWR